MGDDITKRLKYTQGSSYRPDTSGLRTQWSQLLKTGKYTSAV